MDKKSLSIKKLHVRRMPGFSNGMNPLEDVSAQINIVAGPNASGKSTTARAIHQLLWPETGFNEIHGQFDVNGDDWSVWSTAGRQQVQRNGESDTLTFLPTKESKSRYMLAMHDLLKDEDSDLARVIYQSSIGGYRFDDAVSKLDYKPGVKDARLEQFRSYTAATEKLDEINRSQQNLRSEQDRLTELKSDLAAAKEATANKSFFELVKSLKKVETEFAEAEIVHVAFDMHMPHVRQDDFDEVCRLTQKISELEKTIGDASTTLEEKRKALRELNLPDEGIGRDTLEELGQRSETIKHSESEIRKSENRYAELQSSWQSALTNIGRAADAELLRKIRSNDLANFENTIRNVMQNDGESVVLKRRLANLQSEIEKAGTTEDAGKLRDGLTALSMWLQQFNPSPGIKASFLWLTGLAALITALAVWLVGPIGLIGLAIVAVCLVLGLKSADVTSNDTTSVRVKDFERTGLTPPGKWTSEQVIARIEELYASIGTATHLGELNNQLEYITLELKRVEEKNAPLLKQIDAYKSSLGVLGSDIKSTTDLHYLITEILRWKTLDDQLAGISESKKTLVTAFESDLVAFNTILAKVTPGSVVTDGDSAKARYSNLRFLAEKRVELNSEVAQIEQRLHQARNDKAESKTALNFIFERLGVADGDSERVRKLVERLEDFKMAHSRLESCRFATTTARKQVEIHDRYSVFSAGLSDLSDTEIQSQIDESARKSETHDAILRQISGIESLVNETASKSSLEKALANHDNALESLGKAARKNIQSIAGDLLVNHVKSRVSKTNLPEVLRKAQQIFSVVTRGNYELRVTENEPPEFFAWDTMSSVGLKLDELSSGTRIQLIMAVRLAFIETQETQVKLPILADELLANSDDERADAIIQTFIELSASGRQLFYFTAQADEVAKWKQRLEEASVDFNVFLLNKLAKSPTFEINRKLPEFNMSDPIAKPDENQSYNRYVKTLNIPQFYPILDEIDQLHVAYLLDDTQMLYELLTAGVYQWGQLKNLHTTGALTHVISHDQFDHLEKRAKSLKEYFRLSSIGLNGTIDREVLVNSNAVSDKYIDKVCEALEECDYDPSALLDALSEGKVTGFRTAKREELQTYLESNGCIDLREPLDGDSINTKIKLYLNEIALDQQYFAKVLNRVLDSLGRN